MEVFDLSGAVDWDQVFRSHHSPGIDTLLWRAASDSLFRAQLLERRSTVADAAGVTLHLFEKAILDNAPVEQLTAVIDALPPGPPGAGLPVGIENLLHRAARNPVLRGRVLELRSQAAGPAGVVLKEVEKDILDGVPAEQLAAIIDAMPHEPPRPWPPDEHPLPPGGALADFPHLWEQFGYKPSWYERFGRRLILSLILALGLAGLGWLLVHLLL